MNIETQVKLLDLKGKLNQISHISFSYSRIEKANPMVALDEDKAQQMIRAYEGLLSDVKNLIMKNEYTNSKDESMERS